MKLRRGTDFWPGELGNMINQFAPGDIVSSVIANSDTLIGSVRSVHPKLNKVMVAWGGGSVVQHDPDEIALHPHMNDFLVQRLSDTRIASRRVKNASDLKRVARYLVAKKYSKSSFIKKYMDAIEDAADAIESEDGWEVAQEFLDSVSDSASDWWEEYGNDGDGETEIGFVEEYGLEIIKAIKDGKRWQKVDYK
jgi:hypothetical protein